MSSGAAWLRFSECASRRRQEGCGQLLQRSRAVSGPPPDYAELLDDELNDDVNF